MTRGSREVDRSLQLHHPGCPGVLSADACDCSPIPKLVEPFTLGPVTLLPFRFGLKACEIRPGSVQRPACLHMAVEVIHRDTGEVTDLTVRSALPYPLREASASTFASWVRHQLFSMLSHEIDEVLFLDGKRLKCPHARGL